MPFLPANHFELDLKTVYLDAAATSQKPNCVIQSQVDFYRTKNASTHSPHSLGQRLESQIEQTRQSVADFLGGVNPSEIVFSSGATDSLNIIANGILFDYLDENQFEIASEDEILIWVGEHHANLLPWERLAKLTKMKLVFFGILANGQMDLVDFGNKLSPKTKFVCLSACSNMLGIINPISEICKLANIFGSIVIVDGTQIVAHKKVNLNCKLVNTNSTPDFFVFSGHKIYAPTGIGILWGKSEWLAKLQPSKLGGDMIESVELGFSGKQQMLSTYKSLDSDPKTQNLLLKTVFKQNPHRLEAGTLNFAGIIGLKTALEWLVANFEDIEKYEQNLFEILKIEMHKLQKNGKIEVYVNLNLANKIPLVSFNLIGQNAFDVATLLDLKGFCVRSGQHCTGPLHDFVGINSSLRVSIGAWNTEVEILNFVRTLQSITN